eukprot:CAMPEP_0113936974 /NCGR_PEP_ID=MMETSP1339-20121228/3702_1 /TAXON_ID=94617 /ORGANISM="Fibrocapsa japonica" /LENGTH=239 /DNA_ID=CAMNT_0000939569 /DNA_START=120 /DNA_END=836 /DNA_ORIENTATION=- /assembly_acc=CAM_ASM_000762
MPKKGGFTEAELAAAAWIKEFKSQESLQCAKEHRKEHKHKKRSRKKKAKRRKRKRESRSRSRSTSSRLSTASVDSLGRDIRPGYERSKQRKSAKHRRRHREKHNNRSFRVSSTFYSSSDSRSRSRSRSSRSRSRSLSSSAERKRLAKMPAPPDPRRPEHDNRDQMWKPRVCSPSGSDKGGYKQGWDQESNDSDRPDPSKVSEWDHEPYLNDLMIPSPVREVPEDYEPPQPEWISKAGGV